MKSTLSRNNGCILGRHSDSAQTGGGILERFQVAFRDLSAVPGPGGEHDMDTCWLVMCLDGELHCTVTGIEQGGEYFLSAGNCLLQYHPCHCRCQKCACRQRVRMLEIVCPATELHKLINDTPLGHDLESAIRQGKPLHMHRPMSLGVHRALAALRETVTTHQTGATPLILAKFLEMIWHFSRDDNAEAMGHVSDATRRAVQKARAILEDNMAEPPDLDHLASEVGMSLSKLKLVFPQVCGMPPYAYLRQIRMERAMILLREQGMSVTEAALEVGYSNLSHFAKTFAAHHGIKPSSAKNVV